MEASRSGAGKKTALREQKRKGMAMDVSSQGSYPANALSNFAAHKFTFDGVECSSMEGLLQSFKTENSLVHQELCKLIGKDAKIRGSEYNWQKRQILYWNGVEYKRDSDDYQNLVTRAYDALFTSDSFRSALRAARNASFAHSIGNTNEREMVLTIREFVSQLNRLRKRLINEYGKDRKYVCRFKWFILKTTTKLSNLFHWRNHNA